MPLDRDLTDGPISPLVREESNVVGQPGGGPLASRIQPSGKRRFRDYKSVVADAAGRAVISFTGPTIGFCWLVERIVVQGGGTARVYVNAETDEGLSDYSPAATLDVADESSPIYVPGGQTFIVVFAAAGAATVCKATIQVEVQSEG